MFTPILHRRMSTAVEMLLSTQTTAIQKVLLPAFLVDLDLLRIQQLLHQAQVLFLQEAPVQVIQGVQLHQVIPVLQLRQLTLAPRRVRSLSVPAHQEVQHHSPLGRFLPVRLDPLLQVAHPIQNRKPHFQVLPGQAVQLNLLLETMNSLT